jgi:hypothetical protein
MLKYLITIKTIRQLSGVPVIHLRNFIFLLHLQKRLEYEQYVVEHYIVRSTGYQGSCL